MKLSARVVLGLLLWAQALFVASTFRSWLVITAFAMLASILVVARGWLGGSEQGTAKQAPRWLQWALLMLLFGTAAFFITAWRIGRQIGNDINPVYLAVDIIAHGALISSMIVWVFHPLRGHLSLLPLGMTAALFSVAAGGASASLAAQTTVALAVCLGFSVGSQIILSSRSEAARAFGSGGPSSERAAWLSSVFSLLTLSILMMGTSAIANATNLVLPTIQNRLQEQLKATLDSVGEQTIVGGTRYVRGGRLGAIRRHMLGNPREVALQVYCKVPPGYLRGSVFDLYRGARWLDSGSVEFSRFADMRDSRDHNVFPTAVGTTELKRDVSQRLQRFPLMEPSSTQTLELEIHNDPMKGPMVFLPLTTHWLEARSRELSVSKHGIVRLGVDVTRPYVAGVGTRLLREELSASNRNLVMDVETSVLPLAKETAASLCQSSQSAPAKAAAISQYFQREFAYSLASVPSPRGVDPLTYFLETKHPAHCEFFASATAIMLRAVDVPTRYVTGYVADEPSEDQPGLWLARNQDAHAWVEAFDEQSGRWFPVESTPGRRYQTVQPDQTLQFDDAAAAGSLDGDDDENHSWLGRMLGWLRSLRTSDSLLVLFRLAQWPLFFGLLFVLWTRYLKPSRRLGDPADLESRKLLRQVDRRLRKMTLVRHPSETLYQFADRIEAAASEDPASQNRAMVERLTHASRWYRSYADARYQGRLPHPIG